MQTFSSGKRRQNEGLMFWERDREQIKRIEGSFDGMQHAQMQIPEPD
jgi:hypothetical protein